MTSVLNVLGRALLTLPFVLFGLGHLQNAPGMSVMVPAWLPGGLLWVYFTGALLILGGIAVNLRKADYWAALGLAALMVTFAAVVHFPNLNNPDATAKMMAMSGFMKDLGLAGGALLAAALSKK